MSPMESRQKCLNLSLNDTLGQEREFYLKNQVKMG